MIWILACARMTDQIKRSSPPDIAAAQSRLSVPFFVIPDVRSAIRNPGVFKCPWILAPAKCLPGQAFTRQNDGP
jgi:hypothetical protein